MGGAGRGAHLPKTMNASPNKMSFLKQFFLGPFYLGSFFWGSIGLDFWDGVSKNVLGLPNTEHIFNS